MKRLKSPRLQPFLAVFFVAASCTIIQDGDITSADQLAELRLTSFEIIQNTNKGNSTISATLNSDSVINITDAATNTKLTRYMEFSLPPLGNNKMKFRSGVTVATKIYVIYTNTKKVYTVGVLHGDSVVELYRFRYSSSGQLNKIVTRINPIDNLPPTINTNDSLLFESGLLTTIRRKSGGSSSDIDVQVNTHTSNDGFAYTVQSVGSYSQNGGGSGQNGNVGNCPSDDNGSPASCFGLNTGGNCKITFTSITTSSLIYQFGLQDQRFGMSGGSGPLREFDTFFFHPTMMLRGQLTHGDILSVAYIIDWLSPGAAVVGNTNFIRDDYVMIRYGYGL